MRGVHRLNKWKVVCFEAFQVLPEAIGFILLRNSKNFFILNLTSKYDIKNYYTQFGSYKDYDEYLDIQRIKTKRRLKISFEESKSTLWTNTHELKAISKILKRYLRASDLSGLCMGSRGGEEVALFNKYLSKRSRVVGVELEPSAKSCSNTIIADFHYPPRKLFGKFDFVYSNSHDQAFNPKLALTAWIKCLKVDGILVLEHSRAHGKKSANRQDPFGVETEILPYLILHWFPNQIKLILIKKAHFNEPGHEIFFFQKV